MVYLTFVLLAAALCFLLLVRLVMGCCSARVRLGRNSRCCLHLSVIGREPRLEKSVRSLLCNFAESKRRTRARSCFIFASIWSVRSAAGVFARIE